MAKQFTGWLDDQGGQHDTLAKAEAADIAFIKKTARFQIEGIIGGAIDWRDETVDYDEIVASAATLVIALEACV